MPKSNTRRTSAPGPAADNDAFPVVGIGASAGGLETCRKLMAALPPTSDMAFILVQHLDPTHASLMVELLAGHTSMPVRQATEGMAIERNNFYVIPPGTYLSVGNGVLHLSQPEAPHGARLPFDFLLRSLAEVYAERAMAVVLSGTGADGSLGLKSVKERGGLIIAQDPAEAAFDGMPRSAIMTGAVDLVLPVDKIPGALITFSRRMALARRRNDGPAGQDVQDWLPEIIELLRHKTPHDFRLYKRGTLQRRIERRMAMAAIESDEMDRYLQFLHSDAHELDLLVKDLLINVTSFFRDPEVFAVLADKIVPDLVRGCAADQALRIWVAGCSTGEEAYSLVMLFREEIAANRPGVKLQVFASDADADAVAIAREGLYPDSIAADVTPERLARFFDKEERHYRVRPDLRNSIVFTVQDVLSDPPFSRLDMVSCRNLLIYLQPEAQVKAISLFHFALGDGGILLLGISESIGASNSTSRTIVGEADPRFVVVSKSARIYRHVGRSRPGEVGFPISVGDQARLPAHPGWGQAASRVDALAQLCRRLVLEFHAPAAILVNDRLEYLYSLGPTERYLHVATGAATLNLLDMVDPALKIKLRSTIQRASEQNLRTVVTHSRTGPGGATVPFTIDVQPVANDGAKLALICFVDLPPLPPPQARSDQAQDAVPRVAELEMDLEATRTELQNAIRNLEIANEQQRAINQEALSINEEYQSTNEELLTSKEELQSLNEELTSLNTQLQESLERQRVTANDLQNILYSTDVATLFLDLDLEIRFFTPATKSLFKLIPGDVGRPLADLKPVADDGSLLSDARAVLKERAPIERQIEAPDGAWYVRRIMPYRTGDDMVEGVVITFVDITSRKLAQEAAEAAMRRAELAAKAKTHFLAAASHDLRQPLQAMALIQGLLAKIVEGEPARRLVGRLDETLGAMAGMLNTLLDIKQIEGGTSNPEMVLFPVNELFGRLRDEYTYHAHARKLELRVVPCSLSINSDPNLLERMVRNLLSNAMKYTKSGKVLLGCRRRAGTLSMEVWDTGIGIPEAELLAIFEEYHQVDSAAHEEGHGLGLGLGLSIVQRLADILGHRVTVRSRLGKGSVFAIEVALTSDGMPAPAPQVPGGDKSEVEGGPRAGSILVVEDDPEVCDLLAQFLEGEGHHVAIARNGAAALEFVTRGTIRPDLVLADYNLPGDIDGLQVAARLRKGLHRRLPVIILTGDMSGGTSFSISFQGCVQLRKPVKLAELSQAIQRLLPPPQSVRRPPVRTAVAADTAAPVIYVVDDDAQLRAVLREVLEAEGWAVEDYGDCYSFLESYRPGREACLLIDAYLPGMSGIELLERLRDNGHPLPSIMITGRSDVPMAVHAMRAGARDFIEKPVGAGELIASVGRALEQSRDASKLDAWREEAANHLAGLTLRQRQVMDLVLAGHPSKNIAADLGISQRTVENHRAEVMRRTGAKSLPALARIALAAATTAEPPDRPADP